MENYKSENKNSGQAGWTKDNNIFENVSKQKITKYQNNKINTCKSSTLGINIFNDYITENKDDNSKSEPDQKYSKSTKLNFVNNEELSEKRGKTKKQSINNEYAKWSNNKKDDRMSKPYQRENLTTFRNTQNCHLSNMKMNNNTPTEYKQNDNNENIKNLNMYSNNPECVDNVSSQNDNISEYSFELSNENINQYPTEESISVEKAKYNNYLVNANENEETNNKNGYTYDENIYEDIECTENAKNTYVKKSLLPKDVRVESIEQFLKTKRCPHMYKAEGCRRFKSNLCPYAHSDVELRPMPDLKKTAMCRLFLRAKCCKHANECCFAHDLQELRSTDGFYKTTVCRFWQKGHCKAGSSCRHAHGDQELRAKVFTHELDKNKSNVKLLQDDKKKIINNENREDLHMFFEKNQSTHSYQKNQQDTFDNTEYIDNNYLSESEIYIESKYENAKVKSNDENYDNTSVHTKGESANVNINNLQNERKIGENVKSIKNKIAKTDYYCNKLDKKNTPDANEHMFNNNNLEKSQTNKNDNINENMDNNIDYHNQNEKNSSKNSSKNIENKNNKNKKDVYDSSQNCEIEYNYSKTNKNCDYNSEKIHQNKFNYNEFHPSHSIHSSVDTSKHDSLNDSANIIIKKEKSKSKEKFSKNIQNSNINYTQCKYGNMHYIKNDSNLTINCGDTTFRGYNKCNDEKSSKMYGFKSGNYPCAENCKFGELNLPTEYGIDYNKSCLYKNYYIRDNAKNLRTDKLNLYKLNKNNYLNPINCFGNENIMPIIFSGSIGGGYVNKAKHFWEKPYKNKIEKRNINLENGAPQSIHVDEMYKNIPFINPGIDYVGLEGLPPFYHYVIDNNQYIGNNCNIYNYGSSYSNLNLNNEIDISMHPNINEISHMGGNDGGYMPFNENKGAISLSNWGGYEINDYPMLKPFYCSPQPLKADYVKTCIASFYDIIWANSTNKRIPVKVCEKCMQYVYNSSVDTMKLNCNKNVCSSNELNNNKINNSINTHMSGHGTGFSKNKTTDSISETNKTEFNVNDDLFGTDPSSSFQNEEKRPSRLSLTSTTSTYAGDRRSSVCSVGSFTNQENMTSENEHLYANSAIDNGTNNCPNQDFEFSEIQNGITDQKSFYKNEFYDDETTAKKMCLKNIPACKLKKSSGNHFNDQDKNINEMNAGSCKIENPYTHDIDSTLGNNRNRNINYLNKFWNNFDNQQNINCGSCSQNILINPIHKFLTIMSPFVFTAPEFYHTVGYED